MGKQPTLKDVGKAAGVSAMTASRVLNGADNVSLVTREKVNRAAQSLGYQMNFVASSLSRRRGRPIENGSEPSVKQPVVIACLVGDEERNLITETREWRLHEVWRGIQKQCSRRNFRAELVWCFDEQLKRVGFQSSLDSRSIRNAILLGIPAQHHIDLAWERMNCVWATKPYSTTDFSACEVDRYSAVRIAIENIAARHRQRPGLIYFTDKRSHRRSHWAAGFSQVVEQFWPDQANIPPLALDPEIPPQKHAYEIQKWVARSRPGVVLTVGNQLSEMIESIQTIRFGRIPVIDLDLRKMPEDEESVGVVQPYSEMGTSAVDLIANQVAIGETGPPVSPMTVTHLPQWHGTI